MDKRDVTSAVFMGACGLAIASAFIPCNQVNMSYGDHYGMKLESMLDLHTGFLCILLPVLTVVFVIAGKRIVSSVLGFVTVICDALSVYHFVDSAEYASRAVANPNSPWGQFANYSSGIEKVTVVHPFGFYLAIAAIALLLLISVINLFVKDAR
ncbi:MAG: hypothetical protein J6Z43_00545 [Clostridiales bacterium]|nr:hypothetical protein [Clostridiales bacterium]